MSITVQETKSRPIPESTLDAIRWRQDLERKYQYLESISSTDPTRIFFNATTAEQLFRSRYFQKYEIEADPQKNNLLPI